MQCWAPQTRRHPAGQSQPPHLGLGEDSELVEVCFENALKRKVAGKLGGGPGGEAGEWTGEARAGRKCGGGGGQNFSLRGMGVSSPACCGTDLPGGRGGMPRPKRAFELELAVGGRSWDGLRGGTASRRGLACARRPSLKMMKDSYIIRNFLESSLCATMPACEPARLAGMKTKSARYASHNVLRRDAHIITFIPHRLHDFLKGVVGYAGLDVIADDFPCGQNPLHLFILCYTPSIQGL